MKVFKFGGASVDSVERIVNMGEIIQRFSKDKLLIVVSAMGKTTNELEKVAEAFFANKKEEAIVFFERVKNRHMMIAKQLLVTNFLACEQQLKDFFTEAEWMLHDRASKPYDYYYDQLVCVGELLSTTIISFHLDEVKIRNKWFDVRDIIRTDDNFRDANIDWDFTLARVRDEIMPHFDSYSILITQGFIGATDENESTTLGREGSDYSAAVFANMLDVESQTIWKDVENVMNADPKAFPNAQPIAELNYNEVIEMAYYGAQVIHPKTIKPLQNKGIPLYVRCFLSPLLPGTVIHNHPVHHLPPIVVVKENQVLVEMKTRDFSFAGDHHIASLYGLLEKIKIKPNLTQNTAISFILVLDDRGDKIDLLSFEASTIFDVQITRGLTLLTIRHYDDDVLSTMTSNKTVLLRQQTPETIQLLIE